MSDALLKTAIVVLTLAIAFAPLPAWRSLAPLRFRSLRMPRPGTLPRRLRLPRRHSFGPLPSTPSSTPSSTAMSTPTRASEYLAALADARETIRILDTCPIPLFIGSDAERRQFCATLRTAVLTHNTDVRILMLHPQSPLVEQRARAVAHSGITPAEYRLRIKRAMAMLFEVQRSLPEVRRPAFHVRLVDSFPSVTYYRHDDEILTSFYPLDRFASDETPRRVPAASAFGAFVESRFHNLWDFSEDLSRHMFCELRLGAAHGASHGGPVLRGVRYVENDEVLYLAFEDDRALQCAETRGRVEVVLPDPEARVPREADVRGVPAEARDLLDTLATMLDAKYPADRETGRQWWFASARIALNG